jgi:hypothetical protein
MPLCVEIGEHLSMHQESYLLEYLINLWDGMTEQHFLAKEGGDELLSQVDRRMYNHLISHE